jgi:hypothetical protein
MYKNNSGLVLSQTVLYLMKHLATRKISAFKSATALILNVVLHYDQPITYDNTIFSSSLNHLNFCNSIMDLEYFYKKC